MTAARPTPATVSRAVLLMFVGAALGILETIVFIASRDDLRAQIREDNPNAADIDSLVNGTMVGSIVIGLVITALWVWLALMVRRGKNWARISTWVVAVLIVMSTLFTLINPLNGLYLTLAVIAGMLPIAVAVLLAMRPSNEFFKTS